MFINSFTLFYADDLPPFNTYTWNEEEKCVIEIPDFNWD